MEQLLSVHDPSPVGYSLTNYLQIGVLGYADDVALISLSADRTSKRPNKISKGSRRADTDMDLNAEKTKAGNTCRRATRATIADSRSD